MDDKPVLVGPYDRVGELVIPTVRTLGFPPPGFRVGLRALPARPDTADQALRCPPKRGHLRSPGRRSEK